MHKAFLSYRWWIQTYGPEREVELAKRIKEKTGDYQKHAEDYRLFEKSAPALTLARKIMGSNFIGEAEVVEKLKLMPNSEVLQVILFKESTLVECSDTHVLMPILPVSIENLWNYMKYSDNQDVASLIEDPCSGGLDSGCFFEGSTHWALVRKDAAPESFNKTWNEQMLLVNENEYVPSGQEFFFSIIIRSLMKNDWCFGQTTYFRVADTLFVGSQPQLEDPGEHLYMGKWVNTIIFRSANDYETQPCIGLASCRRPDF